MREYTVTFTRVYEITVLADDYDRAIEIAEDTPLSDEGWELIEEEFDAEAE
jgi:hypothetical protein